MIIETLFLSALAIMSSCILDIGEIAVFGLIDTLLSCPNVSNATMTWFDSPAFSLFHKGSPFFGPCVPLELLRVFR